MVSLKRHALPFGILACAVGLSGCAMIKPIGKLTLGSAAHRECAEARPGDARSMCHRGLEEPNRPYDAGIALRDPGR